MNNSSNLADLIADAKIVFVDQARDQGTGDKINKVQAENFGQNELSSNT